MNVTIQPKGDYHKTEDFLKSLKDNQIPKVLKKFGEEGVKALSSATPQDSGLTARSWSYEIIQNRGSITLAFNNSHVEKGVNIAVILQMGHGTRNGGYVKGRDYINPVLQPVFDKIADEAWKEVTKK